MLQTLSTAYALVVLLTTDNATSVRPASPAVAGDSAAEAMVLGEVRAFYRDLDRHNWASMLDHFLPSKVTARWVPPRDAVTWARLAAPAPSVGEEASAPGRCAVRAAVAVVGDWARVRARRCAAGVDEAWLLRVSGRWKIVYLELAPSPQLTRAEP